MIPDMERMMACKKDKASKRKIVGKSKKMSMPIAMQFAKMRKDKE
jgi:hypothetical protein